MGGQQRKQGERMAAITSKVSTDHISDASILWECNH